MTISIKHINKVLFLTTTVFLNVICSSGQTNRTKFNADSQQTISKTSFDKLVDTCIILLQTKKMTEISDSGHIHIMMCLNTIFMAHDEKFQNKLQGGRYSKLKKAAEDKNYTKDIIDVFPNWIPNRGMGFYFPKLKMELYGTPGPYAWFTVTEE